MYSFADVERILNEIQHERSFWGSAQPKEWQVWVLFGPGGKVKDPSFTPRLWTVTGARNIKRKNAGRAAQREANEINRAKRRADADAKLVISMIIYFRKCYIPTNMIVPS